MANINWMTPLREHETVRLYTFEGMEIEAGVNAYHKNFTRYFDADAGEYIYLKFHPTLERAVADADALAAEHIAKGYTLTTVVGA